MIAAQDYRSRALAAEARIAELEEELAVWRGNAQRAEELAAREARRIQVQDWARPRCYRAGCATPAALLLAFLDHPGVTLSRERLLSFTRVPGADPDYEPMIKVVDVHLVFVRKALASYPAKIENVWGVGYRLPADAAQAIRAEIFGEGGA